MLLWLLLLPAAVAGDVKHSTNPGNGLQGWHFSDGDIEIELVQRLPDQTRALFMQHAFSSEVIEELATSCMFQTIVRNTGTSDSGQPVSVDLTAWRVQHAGNTGPIKLKEPWMASWPEEAADPAARLVFRWGMFPIREDCRHCMHARCRCAAVMSGGTLRRSLLLRMHYPVRCYSCPL
jgi:hypothetical protein